MIYFIECGEYVKIGYTQQELRKRVSAFASASPYPVKLLFAVRGSFEDEQALHKQFAEYHHRGEWFKKTPELLAGIELAVAELQSRPIPEPKKIDTRKFALEVASNLGLNDKETKLMLELAQLTGAVQA